MAQYAPNFLLTGERFVILLRPEIEKGIRELAASDMMLALLVRNQASFIARFIHHVPQQEEGRQSN